MSNAAINSRQNLSILLFCAVLSGVGTGVTLIAINWVLLKTYQSSAIIGSLIAASYVASFLLLPVVSSFLDRFDKPWLMRNVNVFGALMQLTALILISMFPDTMLIATLIVITILSVVIRMTDQMTRIALGQSIVGAADYGALSKKLEVCRQSITFLSGGIAAYLLVQDNIRWILIIDALTFIIAAALFWQLGRNIQQQQVASDTSNPANAATQKAPPHGIIGDIKFTLSYIKSDKTFFYLNLLAMFPYALVLAQNTLYPAHIEYLLKLDASYYAMMAVPFGLGAFSAPMISRLLDRRQYSIEQKIISGFVLFCFASVGIFALPNIIATYVFLFIFAAGHALIRIERLANMMQVVGKDKIGRISGFYEFLGMVLVVLFSVAVGFVADWLSVTAAWIFMLIMISTALVGLLVVNSSPQMDDQG